jgi:hypothetical protein
MASRIASSEISGSFGRCGSLDGGLQLARRRLLGAGRIGVQEEAGQAGGGEKAERRSSGGHGALRFVRWRNIALS